MKCATSLCFKPRLFAPTVLTITWPRRQTTTKVESIPAAHTPTEADTPQHCDHCCEFLENPLTTDGYVYVSDAIEKHRTTGRGNRDVLNIWAEYYLDDSFKV